MATVAAIVNRHRLADLFAALLKNHKIKNRQKVLFNLKALQKVRFVSK